MSKFFDQLSLLGFTVSHTVPSLSLVPGASEIWDEDVFLLPGHKGFSVGVLNGGGEIRM